MAAPTVWGFTGVAGTTKTFPIEGTNLYGVDIAGTLTPVRISIAPNVYVLLTAVVTDAALAAAMISFAKRYGSGRDDAGGTPDQGTLQVAVPLVTTS